MSAIFSRAGFNALKVVYGIASIGIAVAVVIVALSYLYWQQQKKSDQESKQILGQLSGRLAGAIRERDDLKDSAQLFQKLRAEGVFLPQDRLELIEAMEALKSRHRLIGLEYEISPMRPLSMPDGRTFPLIDINASRIKMKINAYHDGDLLAFLDEFSRMSRGFFPLQTCSMQREKSPVRRPASASSGEGQPASTSTPVSSSVSSSVSIAPGLHADCMLDWISLREKGATTNGSGSSVSTVPNIMGR